MSKAKYTPDISPEALRATLTGFAHQVELQPLPPLRTHIHDKDTVILTQGQDVIVIHAAMLVNMVRFINSQTNPVTGDFTPIPESSNVH